MAFKHTAYTPVVERYVHPHEGEATPEATPGQLIAEISARLIEWSELESKARATSWLVTCVELLKASPTALWLYLSWQTGDAAVISKSFAALAEEAALPKQGIHQSHKLAFAKMAQVFPELAATMRAMFERHRPEAVQTHGKNSVRAA